MILVETDGGLGNQMFQYAIGYILSKKHNEPLVIKDKLFYHNINGDFVKIFPNAIYQLVSQKQIDLFHKNKPRNTIKKILRLPWHKIYEEKQLKFDPNIFKILPPVLLKGFWQSEKYFSDFDYCIRYVFTFNSQIDSMTNEYYQKIASKNNSVAIHVRRGDYLFNDKNYLKHGVCSFDYYKNAIEDMRKKLETPYFFVFSDDQDWSEKSICTIGSDFELVKTNNTGSSSWKDMFLMSVCKNQIIANSSFSWWAAWLNNNLDKIVIAPTKWFSDDKFDLFSSDIVPESWTRL